MGGEAKVVFRSISKAFNPQISGLSDPLLRMFETLQTFLSPAITQFFYDLDATKFVCFFL